MEAIRAHPFVARLDRSIRLEAGALTALERLLSRRVVAKKAKDIIVEGYKYEALHIVERGIAIRYRLLQSGKRQIVNVVLPGDIIGFPACFYEHAVFSVSAVEDMKLSHVPLDAFTALCLGHATVATALVWRPRSMPSTSSMPAAANRCRVSHISSWRC
jgi:CRP-like cAMP-binding protein